MFKFWTRKTIVFKLRDKFEHIAKTCSIFGNKKSLRSIYRQNMNASEKHVQILGIMHEQRFAKLGLFTVVGIPWDAPTTLFQNNNDTTNRNSNPSRHHQLAVLAAIFAVVNFNLNGVYIAVRVIKRIIAFLAMQLVPITFVCLPKSSGA